MKNKRQVMCIKNDDYEISLSIGKMYWVLEDHDAQQMGMIRVIADDNDEYLFPQDYFAAIVSEII